MEDSRWRRPGGRLEVEDAEWRRLEGDGEGRGRVGGGEGRATEGRVDGKKIEVEEVAVDDSRWMTLGGRASVEEVECGRLRGGLWLERAGWKTQWRKLSGINQERKEKRVEETNRRPLSGGTLRGSPGGGPCLILPSD